MKRNNFLTAMPGILLCVSLVFGMAFTGCDADIAAEAQKALAGMSNYTIVLGGVDDGATYTAAVYNGTEVVGGGAAKAAKGSASIRLAPNSGQSQFSERTYRVWISSGTTVKESTSVNLVAGGNTPLNWSTMTVIEGGETEEGEDEGNEEGEENKEDEESGEDEGIEENGEEGEDDDLPDETPDEDGDNETDGDDSAQIEASYRIDLSKSGTHIFTPVIGEGYETPAALTVTVGNTGNQPTGDLTVALSGDGGGSFALSNTVIDSIAESETATFTVTPKIGLATGTYTATVTVSGGNGIFAGFSVSFTVNPPAESPVYGIALSENGTYPFPAATAGYGAQEAKSVTISNTGNQPTGNLTLSLSNSSLFTLSTTSVSSIAASGTDAFTVTPKTGLAAGNYNATVTVSGGNVTSKSFSVSFTVNPAPVYGINLDATGTHTFPVATEGYGAQSAKTVNISNTGNQPTGNLTLALSNSTAFTLSSTAINSIGVNGSNSFTVTPKTGLTAGNYSATVTVSGGSVTSKSFSVSFTVTAAPTYGISLNPQTWTFPAAIAGYGAQTTKSVTITNTGNQPTGNLTLSLSNSSLFTLSTTAVNSIAAGGTDAFTMAPKTGLAAGNYSATVTVSGGNITLKYLNVNFTVNAPAPAPTYGISLNPQTWTFPAATEGYGAQTAKSVTISNTGNQPTGNLTLSLSNSSLFTLSTTSVNSIAAGSTGVLTVTPKTGLAAGTYSATVTVSGGSVTSKSFSVSFTVNAAPAYGISLNPQTWTFPAASAGYGAQTAKSVTISNIGTQPTGNLTIALSNSSAFTLSSTSINSIAAGGSSPFTVTPKTGLAAGSYSATVTVSGGSVTSKTFSVSFTVTGFSSVAAAIAYLNSYAGGSSFNAPVPLKMNINLDSATDGWTTLLNGLAGVNKYVALDLSSCSMSGTLFSLSRGDVGKSCIANLVLPDSVTFVGGAGQTTTSPYPNLRIISGSNVTSIGAYTFYYYGSLTTANFPKTTTIGSYAFDNCTSLTTVDFPKATSIEPYVFGGCKSLTSVSFPAATSIGTYAFGGCTALTTVSFPEVESIMHTVFSGCMHLTSVSIPKVTSIGHYTFRSNSATPLTITMGRVAPIIGIDIFQNVTGTKNVTVRVPSSATGYGYSWEIAFRGYGSPSYPSIGVVNYGALNYNINVVMEYY
jgi:uncharacterized membrane protein